MDIDTIDENRIQEIKELYALISRLSKIDKALILLWLDEKNYNEIGDIIGIKSSRYIR